MADPTSLKDALPLIRARLAQSVSESSLRAVAREIGMSPTGLREFIDGTDPYRPTVTKVLDWWLRTFGHMAPVRESRVLAVEAATRDLPPALGARAAEQVLELLESVDAERLDAVERALRRSVRGVVAAHTTQRSRTTAPRVRRSVRPIRSSGDCGESSQ